MATVETPGIDFITQELTQAVNKVTETMIQVSTQLVEGKHLPNTCHKDPFLIPSNAEIMVVGAIGFTGEVNGVTYLYLGKPLAHVITARMTGMEMSELEEPDSEEIVNDVIGELSNMSVGSFKTSLCDHGLNCTVTLPTVLRGRDLSIDSIDTADRWAFRFQLLDEIMVADLFIQKRG